MIKSDNPNEIGTHIFEMYGMGKAPYRFIGFTMAVYQAHPDAPRQPGANCRFCGTGIMNVYTIMSADGIKSNLGCDCIDKSGDDKLIKAYKNSKEHREMERQKRAARDERVQAEWSAMMADACMRAKMAAVTVNGYHGPESWLDMAERVWGRCGAAGRARYLRAAKRILAAP